MATFFRSIFQNKDLNLKPHLIKSANINIYACILLHELNFKADEHSCHEKLLIFQVSIAKYSYHVDSNTTMQWYIDPSMIISYCYIKDLDPSRFLIHTKFNKKSRTSWIKHNADRYLQYHQICFELGLINKPFKFKVFFLLKRNRFISTKMLRMFQRLLWLKLSFLSG